MPTAQPILSLDRVTLRYEHGITALDDVSLSIAEGERICVLGPNGSGKSTLASVLCGLLAPDEGTVQLVGETVFGPNGVDFEAYRRARRQVGLVFQNPDDQIVTSVVEEDVAFGPENLGVASHEIGVRVARELHRVAMEDYAQADPSRLSGGQKQRVAIAGALAMEPRVLVLDEPGASLDVRGRNGIMRVMEKLHQTGVTIVHVTHFMEEALAADRVVVMSMGHIVLQGTPHEVFSHSSQLMALGLEEPFTAQLAEAIRARRVGVPWTCSEHDLLWSLGYLKQQIDEASGSEATELADGDSAATGMGEVPRADRTAMGDCASENAPEPIDAHLGTHKTPGVVGTRETLGAGQTVPSRRASQGAASAADRAARRAPATTVPAVQATALSYTYGETDAREARHPALDAVDLVIPQGSFTAIVGQTGSGKSTLLRLICALEVPDAGRLVVDGIDTSNRRQRRQLYGRVGYVMQHPERQLFAETVWDDVAYGPTNMHLSAQEVEQRCRRALDMVGLTGREQASPFHLSGGQQRLCALAGILAMQPHILVLDEPTAGLDPRGRTQLRGILNRIHEQGLTVIYVTHSMDDAATAQQVIVFKEGKVLMQGAPQDVYGPHTEEALRACGLGLPEPLAWALRLAEQDMDVGLPLTLDPLADRIANGWGVGVERVRKALLSPHTAKQGRPSQEKMTGADASPAETRRVDLGTPTNASSQASGHESSEVPDADATILHTHVTDLHKDSPLQMDGRETSETTDIDGNAPNLNVANPHHQDDQGVRDGV